LSAILDGRSEPALPDEVSSRIAKTTIEILNLRPAMSYGLSLGPEESTARAQSQSVPRQWK
jgi:hypothetical protein